MMDSLTLLDAIILLTLVILSISCLLICVRIIKGPSLADRIVGLDMLVAVGIGFIAVFGVKTDYYLYVDIAIALGLVGFLSTVAFARFILRHGDDSVFHDKKEAEAAEQLAEKARKGEEA